ncbi:MAG: DUF6783 domain-containing protein [Blautia faecis]
MCITICGRFRPDEGAVAGYGNRIRVKYTAKWGVQIAGMIFQTRSSICFCMPGTNHHGRFWWSRITYKPLLFLVSNCCPASSGLR